MDEMRVWTCENGHVLGLVRRNGRGITQLMVYRQAVDMAAEEPEPPEVMALVEGTVFDIRCSACESVRTWMAGEEAMKRLLESRERHPPPYPPPKVGGTGLALLAEV